MTVLPNNARPEVGGAIQVAARVVEKTAAHLAATVPGVGAPASQVLGLGRGVDFDNAPRLRAHIDGGRAFLTVDCAVEYPRPLGPTADQVRRILTERLGDLSGVPAARVDVNISHVSANLATRRHMQ